MGLERDERGQGGGGGAGVTASHRDTACSVDTGRGAGRAARGGAATGHRGQRWAEGSPGANAMRIVRFSAPLLCSLRSPPNSGLEFLCEKRLPQCSEGGLLTSYNMGKCIPQLVVI